MILAPTLTLSAGSGAAIVRPTFSRDFAGEKTLNNGTGPAITFTRASNATFFDASGVLQTASNDAPRFDHDPATGASRGLLIEEARTNSIRNSQAGGAVAGVSGTMPTNWSSAASQHGLTREIVATGVSNGVSYIDIRYSGTTNSTSGVGIFFDGAATSVASAGQTWTASVYIALVGGSTSGTTAIRAIVHETNGTTNVQSGVAQMRDSLTSSLQRFSVTRTFTEATATHSRALVDFSYNSGATIDLTLRIAAPQLEQGAFPTSYIPTTTAAATRSADFARVTPISSFYNQSEGTAFAEYSRFQISANSKALLFLDNATPSRYLGIESTADGTASRFISQNNAGSTVASLSYGNAAANTVYKQIGTYKENDFIAAQNGTLTSADTSGTPTDTLDRMGVGCLPGVGNFPLNGHIRKIAYYPKRLSNTLLQQLTT